MDLSGNQLNGEAFDLLRVEEHNYDEVDNLTLDNNDLDSLPEKLLEMRLGLSFSARNNRQGVLSVPILPLCTYHILTAGSPASPTTSPSVW